MRPNVSITYSNCETRRSNTSQNCTEQKHGYGRTSAENLGLYEFAFILRIIWLSDNRDTVFCTNYELFNASVVF